MDKFKRQVKLNTLLSRWQLSATEKAYAPGGKRYEEAAAEFQEVAQKHDNYPINALETLPCVPESNTSGTSQSTSNVLEALSQIKGAT